MKITLHIKDHTNIVMEGYAATRRPYFTAYVSSSSTGKRLLFPGVQSVARNKQELIEKSLAYLLEFGFNKEDVTVMEQNHV